MLQRRVLRFPRGNNKCCLKSSATEFFLSSLKHLQHFGLLQLRNRGAIPILLCWFLVLSWQYLSILILFVNLCIGKDAQRMEKMHATADICSINDIRLQTPMKYASQVHGKEKLDEPYEGVKISVNFTSLSAATKSSGDLVFCVANSRADPIAVKKGLDWACGPGLANCTAIQPGQPCYEQGNLIALASYAYNDYYQKARVNGGTCNFDNSAIITTTDPSKFSSEFHGFTVLFVYQISHGSCIFTGSSGGKSPINQPSSSPIDYGGFDYPLQFPREIFLFGRMSRGGCCNERHHCRALGSRSPHRTMVMREAIHHLSHCLVFFPIPSSTSVGHLVHLRNSNARAVVRVLRFSSSPARGYTRRRHGGFGEVEIQSPPTELRKCALTRVFVANWF
ncbi:hypothetical protein ZIOFF_001993 [Zingiber officinale]|uniref:X8 domain-containing protein n=1 Tax=Zingiber officinale TaxID=94328 RepID=A0A8J5IL83_ZINOF|nr:hypothetical protein ZIOFF_001993 [Zingiber officinale]